MIPNTDRELLFEQIAEIRAAAQLLVERDPPLSQRQQIMLLVRDLNEAALSLQSPAIDDQAYWLDLVANQIEHARRRLHDVEVSLGWHDRRR